MTGSALAVRRASAVFALTCVLLSSCGDPVGPNGVASVRISGAPLVSQVFMSQFAFLVANQYGEDGKPLPGAHNFLDGIPVTWTISDTIIAQMTTQRWNAELTFFLPGVVVVTATSDGKKASVQFTIVGAPITSVSIDPPAADVTVGTTTQLTATANDSLGVYRHDRPVTWASSNTTVATVSADGLVAGLQPGNANITATVDGKIGTANINVIGP